MDPTPTDPIITAGYSARWVDSSGDHPGEHQKRVVRKSFIEPACADHAGFSITLTESVEPGVGARYLVRWREGDRDETEAFVGLAAALRAYERRMRDFRARCLAEGNNEDQPGM